MPPGTPATPSLPCPCLGRPRLIQSLQRRLDEARIQRPISEEELDRLQGEIMWLEEATWGADEWLASHGLPFLQELWEHQDLPLGARARLRRLLEAFA